MVLVLPVEAEMEALELVPVREMALGQELE